MTSVACCQYGVAHVVVLPTSAELSDAGSGAGLSLVEGAPPVVVEGSHPTTLEECKSIIRHLKHTNEKQSHEVCNN